MFTLVLILTLHTTPSDNPEFAKVMTDLTQAWSKQCPTLRQLCGTVTVKSIDSGGKETVSTHEVKGTPDGYLYVVRNGTEVSGSLSRPDGPMQQELRLGVRRGSKDLIINGESYMPLEQYRKTEFYFVDRELLSRWFLARGCQPIEGRALSIMDVVEYPAFKLLSMQKVKGDNEELIKIDYDIDQAINNKKTGDEKITGVKRGSFTVAPARSWVLVSSTFEGEEGRSRATRKWQSDYTYVTKPQAIPIIKTVKSRTIDNNPDAKLLPQERTTEYQLEVVTTKLPADAISFKQYGVEDRTYAHFLADVERDKQIQLKEQNNSAPTPAGGFAIASQPFTLSPWMILSGSGVIVVLIILVVFLSRGGKKGSV